MKDLNLYIFKYCVLAGMLIGLPLPGIVFTNLPLQQYLQFPPTTRYVVQAPFSWPAFVCIALFILAAILPLIIKGFQEDSAGKPDPLKLYRLPWWGWAGIITGLIAWTLAWTRFPWFAKFQPHTFNLLWLSYILVMNALTYQRKGHCMIIDRPGFFFLLFPASAVFWWFFEYLNRFVQNWYYTGVTYSPLEYFLYASLSFSTVLPAVLSTREWISGTSWLQGKYKSYIPLHFVQSRTLAWTLLLISGAGLSCIGILPNYLFPLVWISPLLIIIALQVLTGETHIFSCTAQGDWSMVVASALAALLCGWFWEMWNYHSLARWEYSVPLVHRYKIFEMPVLGYAGYIPFGLECAAVGSMLEKLFIKFDI